MSQKTPSSGRPSKRERRVQARIQRAEQVNNKKRTRSRRRIVGLAAVGIVVVLAIMVAARTLLLSSQASSVSSGEDVPPAVLDAVAKVPAASFQAVQQAPTGAEPAAVRAELLRDSDGLPRVVYIGAEYCPYCAAERWAVVVALSRFGTFSGLKTAHSAAAPEVYPLTPTFSFYGAKYESQYVAFEGVELETSTMVGGTYQKLQTPTPDQESLIREYDAPPYVPAQVAGAIPFVDYGNQYVTVGSSIDLGLLQGHSREEIAASLADPQSDIGKSILGRVNVVTAMVCSTTGDKPDNVCGEPQVKAISALLAGKPVPTATQ